MRRTSTILIALVILGICTSSFANYFLVYNVSMTVKGIDFGYLHGPVTVPLKGYLLLNFSDLDGFADANLVLYGKDAAGSKVYVQLGRHGDNLYLGSSSVWSNYSYLGVVLDGGYAFGFRGQMIGKMAMKNIGLGSGTNKNVASSLKGVMNVEEGMLLDSRQNIAGTASVSMTLNSSYTKAVNGTDPTWTQDQIIHGQLIGDSLRGIIPDLEAKNYEDATPNIK